MAILGQSFLHLAFLEKWLPESRFTITYVRMKKKSHKGPDAQGPRSDDIQPGFPVPSSELEICSPELLTYIYIYISCTAEGKGQVPGMGFTTARVPSRGMQRKC